MAKAAWEKTEAGKATLALYAAAEKAGGEMASALRYGCLEVTLENGEFCLFYEPETHEHENKEWEKAFRVAFQRAHAWTKKYAAKHGRGYHVWYFALGYVWETEKAS